MGKQTEETTLEWNRLKKRKKRFVYSHPDIPICWFSCSYIFNQTKKWGHDIFGDSAYKEPGVVMVLVTVLSLKIVCLLLWPKFHLCLVYVLSSSLIPLPLESTLFLCAINYININDSPFCFYIFDHSLGHPNSNIISVSD